MLYPLQYANVMPLCRYAVMPVMPLWGKIWTQK